MTQFRSFQIRGAGPRPTLEGVRRLGLIVLALGLGGCFGEPPGTTSSDTEDPSSTSGPTSSSGVGTGETGTASSSSPSSSSSSDDATTSASTDDASESSTGSRCPDATQCLAPAPADWTGPFAVVIDDAGKPTCPEGWPDPVSTVHADLIAPEASCECACTPPSSVCSAAVELHLDGTCTSLDIAHPTNASGCTQTIGAASVRATSAAVAIDPPACSGEPMAAITAPQWGSTASLCASSSAAEPCDAGECRPIAPAMCILREGEHECPDGPYIVGAKWWSGVIDDRGCSACTCGPPVAASCDGLSQLEVYDSADCSGLALDSMAMDQCGTAGGSARYLPESLGECSVESASTPTGSATEAGPVTLCCLN
jgi:hypothetical protein